MIETGKIKLLNMDCMAFMATCKDKEFDLAICDIPYGSKNLVKNKFGRHKNTNSYKNESIPAPEYFKELERVATRSIIWGCQYVLPYLNPEGSFIIWDKGADPDLHNMSACDVAWYSKRERIRKFKGHWCGAVKCETEPTIHIHQKPVSLYRWLLRHFAKPGEKILDTHGGSCPLAIACYDSGFDCTITEIDKDYYQAAVKRFTAHKSQTKLNFAS